MMEKNFPESTTRDAVAARLKAARTAKFATAALAARAVGMRDVTVRAHESGQNGLSAVQAAIYAKHYGVTPEWLLFGGDEPRRVTLGDKMKSTARSIFLEPLVIRNTNAIVLDLDISEQLRRPIVKWLELKKEIDYPIAFEYPITPPGYENVLNMGLRMGDDSGLPLYAAGHFVVVSPFEDTGLREGDCVVLIEQYDDFERAVIRRVKTEAAEPNYRMVNGAHAAFVNDIEPALVILFGVVTGAFLRPDRSGRPIKRPGPSEGILYEL